MDNGFVCPCGSTEISVYYTCPAQFKCRACGRDLIDGNAGPAIPVLTEEQAKERHPSVYGLPHCKKCMHRPHEGACWKGGGCVQCDPPPGRAHVYSFRYA